MIRLIDTKEEFFSLRDGWNKLLYSMDSPNFFLTWEWMYTWWDYYFSNDRSYKLFIILVTDQNGKLVGIFPAYIKHSKGIFSLKYRTLRFLGSEIEDPDYLDLITESSIKEMVLNEIFDYLKDSYQEIDYIELTDIIQQSSSMDLFLKTLKNYKYYNRKYIGSVCPYLKLPSDFEKYLTSLSSNFRYNLRRRSKFLFNKEGVKFNEVVSKNELEPLVEILFSLHKKRWEGNIHQSIFYNKKRIEFHSRLASMLYDSALLRLFYLSVNEEVIACLYSFEYKNKIYFYQSGFDPRWALKSPGLVLMGKIIERCILEKKEEFDFLRGKEHYKLKWTSDFRQTCNIEVGLTLKGKLVFLYKIPIFYMKAFLKYFRANETLYHYFIKRYFF